MPTVHVVPVDDLIEHDSSGQTDCMCGPTTEPVPRDDGTFGWLITHHSLDGREAHEQENTMSEPTGPKHEAPTPVPGTPAAAARDARTRALRTLLQGAISTGLVAAAAVVVDTVTAGSVIDWPALGLASATAVGTALAAWVQRKLESARA